MQLNCYPWVLKMFTSKTAADMPSETELLTTAKHLFMAVWSSCWLLSWVKKTPAVLQGQRHSSVLRDSGLIEAWMMLKGSDKLRAANTAVLCVACTWSPGKSPNQSRQLRATKIFVVVKALGKKPKDQLQSGRTDKKEDLGTPLRVSFCSHYIKRSICYICSLCRVGKTGRKNSPQISQRSKLLANTLSSLKSPFKDMMTIREQKKRQLTFERHLLLQQ